MSTSKIVWVKKFFDSRYLLYQDGKQVGFLVNSAFKMRYTGELFGERIFLNTNGFFKRNLIVYDSAKNKIGEVRFDFLKTRAKILFSDEVEYDFAFTNLFFLKWLVAGERITK